MTFFLHMHGGKGMQCCLDIVARESVCGKRELMDEIVQVYDGTGKVCKRE